MGLGVKKSLLYTCIVLLPAVSAFADIDSIEKMLVIGSIEGARSLPGSGAVISSEQLRTEVTTDINQVLKTIPGIYIREEDGLGLRPNIGIRGATSERSGKITLMEDGVLIAPAPYSNPEAYYFPTTLRMSLFEVLKGAPLLRHGPQTTGGIVNMLSTTIPKEMSGSVLVTADQRGSSDIHAYFGGQDGDWRFLLETVQRDGEGFKDVDRSSQNPGYDISDYVFKLGWTGERQDVLLKLQSSEEVSNETYLGLSDKDFNDDPNRRYGLSSIDEMDNNHKAINLSHTFKWSDTVTSTATVYKNDFARNWFKLNGGGDLVEAANDGGAPEQAILDGSAEKDGLSYKNNNRKYISEGVQLNVDIDAGDHQLAVGLRRHHDEMDRFQIVDTYKQESNGDLVFQSSSIDTGEISGSNNREEEADALSFWVTDSWQVNDALKVNLALRYEDIESSRLEYSDTARTTFAANKNRQNDTAIWLPGVSFSFDLSDQIQLLAGVHKGFSPLGGGANASQDPEESKNWEAGIRFNNGHIFMETIAFYSDITDTTENCSVASPCSNSDTSGSFALGESAVSGLELQISAVTTIGAFQIPLDAAFTYTKAEITKDNAVSGFESGDDRKDIPERVFSLRVGFEHQSGWNNYIVAKYIDEMCSVAGCNRTAGNYKKTEKLFVMDYISRYQLTPDVEVFLKTENIFDQQRIVSRNPDGARPNRPRTTLVGIQYDF
ncbi:MAG: Fe(3+) dicitrate transport protein [Zhongshania sp.]|jgi:Fe(3+) dicitrate transport protein